MWDANRTMVGLEQHTQPAGSMFETLEVLWYLFVTHLAALRWTISSECFCLEMCGSQTVAAYSVWPHKCVIKFR